MPKADKQVARLLASREDIFPGYTQEGFENEFGEFFEVQSRQEIRNTERTLYLLKNKSPASG